MPDLTVLTETFADDSGLPDLADQGSESAALERVDAESPSAPPTKREREAEWMRLALEIRDMSELPMSDLRVLADRMFRLLDSDHPPFNADERYAAAVAEIKDRSRQRSAQGPAAARREVFKDSAFGSRFELFLDGRLAAYLRYALVGGQLTLRVFVEMPGFEGSGLGPVLMRHAMLHAHKRRLSVVPGCEAALTFLSRNPQYRALARVTPSPVILGR